ncbi:sugar transferase [Eubacterium oxidoreducens]|uniref:Haloacid dehalogenase-like hydrolase n=1 Tax=Eubacterium oxidoreducens TaxID=1732 RepID=A0A1G6BL13_EUBOX|nr:sugar transferase [Eubacterium oxidoreducens]SDB21288.1 Haloacid dehalogenase-like hydrolase [Eubacterium oxidoreducens]
MYRSFVKRLLDLVFSTIILVVFCWVYLILAILVRVKLGKPVIFAQERTGHHNTRFVMYKFRTMTSETDANGELLPDEMRLTRFGAMLRSTSLDELPEIVNIFKGNMSFVGPRPLLPNYVDLYSPRQRRRHEVKPGLTGLAQVNGRNAIEWEEKFEFDLEYSDNISFALDFKILCLTVKKVFARADISSEGSATTESFAGTKRKRFGSKHKEVVKVLFTNPGNKNELIQTFLYAAGNLGIQIETYATDTTLGLPAMLMCQKEKRVSSPKAPEYVDQILDICRKEHIDLVVPLSEDDRILASAQAAFHKNGTRLLLSKLEVTQMCMDKRRVMDYFRSCGLHTTVTADNLVEYTGGFPAAIELRDENKGVYSYRVENEKELQYYIMRFEKYLIRPFVNGTEYEIDVFCDFEGKPIYITPKRRETVQEKEVARYRVVQDAMMIKEVQAILEELKPVGPLTIGVVKEEATGYNYFVGMRPLFSVDAPISIKAGADSPQAALKMMFGATMDYQQNAADDDLLFSRVERTIQIKQNIDEVHPFESFNELPEQLGSEIEAVVFDLDDTLYSQKEYMRSALREVAEHLPQVRNCYNRMCAALEKGEMPIEAVLKKEKINSEELLRECLDIFIEHYPKIELYPGVVECFRELRKKKMYLAVVTDGKPVMQNNKIDALGLDKYVDEILITDELAGHGNVHEFRKPNDIAYLIMRKRLGIALRNMAYVGEDPKLDFEAPQKLGMVCYQYVNPDRLYEEEEDG